MNRWTATVARGDQVQRSNRRCSTSGSSRSHTMQRLHIDGIIPRPIHVSQYSFFFYVCVGTPRRTEGAGLARDGQNNAAKMDWQI